VRIPLAQAAQIALAENGLPQELAHEWALLDRPEDIHLLMAQANWLRARTRGDEIDLCAIINARSGRCSEDCSFCAQSAHHGGRADVYPFLEPDQIMAAAQVAQKAGVRRFSIVTSGRGTPGGAEMDRVDQAIKGIAGLGLSPCASLGLLDADGAARLKKAGLVSYHHNLETAASFFPQICTTHPYEDRIQTIRLARSAGFRVCSGGIIGLGESPLQRLELAYTLKELAPESIPLNFLNPIPGTPLEHQPALKPMDILLTIALFRLILPMADIRTCGGRERNLRGLQPLMFLAGANATMVGNYLTTTGRNPEEDLRDIQDLGLRLAGAPER
jgi:biotin synthase